MVRLEHAVLLGRGQPGVERQHLQVRPAGQGLGRVPDLPLAGQEHQDVPRALREELVHRVADALHLVPGLPIGVVRVGERPVAHLDRVGAARHLDHRRVPALLA